MKNKWSFIGIAVLLAITGLGMACDEADDANKLVDEANAIVTKSNDSSSKITSLYNDLLGDKLVKSADVEKYKVENKGRFDELIGLIDRDEKDLNDVAAKFEKASTLKVSDKFKEYTSLSSQQFKKRTENRKAMGIFIKAFLAEKDTTKRNQLGDEFDKRSAELGKEGDALSEKADKIVADNPGEFQSK